jgi:hypothetical protein
MNWHACLAAHHLNHRLYQVNGQREDDGRILLPRQTLSWEWLRCFSRARLLVLVRYVMEPQAAHQDHGEKEREHREDER